MINITNYDIEIKRHAFIRALERGVSPDIIEATLKEGKIERFGKKNLKFIKKYRRFTVICVDQIVGNRIKIVTIEIKR
jgi:hypothetical protein